MNDFINKYKSMAAYVFFGALTTLINIISYSLCYKTLNISNVSSNIIAWVFSVLFAFITNKLWVFESRDLSPAALIRELLLFTSARLVSGALDVAVMYVSVDIFALNAMAMKIITNVVVVILNYVFSKFLIFKNKSE